ncbi:hypothetical protein PROFUN_14550 [Planoprotostelium fungivorum]|uniref:Uncharacterized protein n=1 Tax=Planoprotostelium fungivorum TaxID=1890364 RepID=A0A2P6MZM0_9EUKA|nr:hypothetical protein PROFUN_14550 [Planoprotostelium fungivorum]
MVEYGLKTWSGTFNSILLFTFEDGSNKISGSWYNKEDTNPRSVVLVLAVVLALGFVKSDLRAGKKTVGKLPTVCVKHAQGTQKLTNVLQRIYKLITGSKHSVLHKASTERANAYKCFAEEDYQTEHRRRAFNRIMQTQALFLRSRFLCKRIATNISGSLSGVRVLDMGRILAAPYCSMILGDYGADVIKIEHLNRGDDTRSWGPPFTAEGGESAYFLSVNRNKRSVAIDLKKKEGLQFIYDLVKQSDVVIENFTPGKADVLGVGYEKLSQINPKIIYTSLTGFGPDGPYKSRLAYDVMISGENSCMGGLMGVTGTEDGTPVKVGVAITDVCTGLFAHGAIMAALISRGQTGVGQKIDASLLETQVAVMANIASNYLIAGIESKPMGTAHVSIVPYQGFKTKDGHIIVGALNDGQFERLSATLCRPDLSTDERFSSNTKRVQNRVALIDIIQNILIGGNTEHWLHVLEEAHVPCGPINSMSQVFNDPQVIHREMIHTIQHPTVGEFKTVGFPVKFSQTPPQMYLPPPILGQHTKEVYKTRTKRVQDFFMLVIKTCKSIINKVTLIWFVDNFGGTMIQAVSWCVGVDMAGLCSILEHIQLLKSCIPFIQMNHHSQGDKIIELDLLQFATIMTIKRAKIGLDKDVGKIKKKTQSDMILSLEGIVHNGSSSNADGKTDSRSKVQIIVVRGLQVRQFLNYQQST